MTDAVVHYFRRNEPSHSLLPSAHEELKARGLEADSDKLVSVETEICFNIGLSKELTSEDRERLEWLLAETFEPEKLKLENSTLQKSDEKDAWLVEFGPRLSFTSAFSSNACSICDACGIPVHRLEASRRYRFVLGGSSLSTEAILILREMLHDRMTEEEYTKPLGSFENGAQPEPVTSVPIMAEGRPALEKINTLKGLGFDDFDLDYYTNLFKVSVALRGSSS